MSSRLIYPNNELVFEQFIITRKRKIDWYRYIASNQDYGVSPEKIKLEQICVPRLKKVRNVEERKAWIELSEGNHSSEKKILFYHFRRYLERKEVRETRHSKTRILKK